MSTTDSTATEPITPGPEAGAFTPSEGGCGGRCQFLGPVWREGKPEWINHHDWIWRGLSGVSGLAALAEVCDHIDLAGDGEAGDIAISPLDLEDFLAQHNWPDPVATWSIARRLHFHWYCRRNESDQEPLSSQA